MRVLLVAATEQEINPLRKEAEKKMFKKLDCEFLITGPGAMATTYHLTKRIPIVQCDLAINIGLAGSFRDEIKLGEVVAVITDEFADLGAEDHENFLSVFELGLMEADRYPFWNGKLKCSNVEKFTALNSLKKVKAITVNTAHGNDLSIQRTRNKFHPDIETMEGAAFHYVCEMEKLPAVQLRAKSNRVERRNREAWDIKLAMANLTSTVIYFLNHL
jgi:futalosine hydrolase